jgi:hypothetical protein
MPFRRIGVWAYRRQTYLRQASLRVFLKIEEFRSMERNDASSDEMKFPHGLFLIVSIRGSFSLNFVAATLTHLFYDLRVHL